MLLPKIHTRESCSVGSKYPLCTDDEWDNKCPSGCRLQGLISATERGFLDRFSDICDRTSKEEKRAEKLMFATKQIYAEKRKIIVKTYVAENKYLELAEELQKKLGALKKRTTDLAKRLAGQYSIIQQQVVVMHRAEVDIDIKIRACRSSCKKAFIYQIDQASYRLLGQQLHDFEQISEKIRQPTEDFGRIKMNSWNEDPPEFHLYKNHPFIKEELLTQLEDIEQYKLTLENVAKKKN